MKKYVLLVLSLGFILASHNAFCADETAAPAADQKSAPAPADEQAAAPTTAPAAAPAAAAPAAEATPAAPEAAPAATPADNLEFISGEISAVDINAKSVTVKLYGETENSAGDKLLTISLDDNTDITDGEKDRDLKSLTAGTEVDVEYDPTTKKATYIFVY